MYCSKYKISHSCIRRGCRLFSIISSLEIKTCRCAHKSVCCWQAFILSEPQSGQLNLTIRRSLLCQHLSYCSRTSCSLLCCTLVSVYNFLCNASDAFKNGGFTSKILIQICWLCLRSFSAVWPHVSCASPDLLWCKGMKWRVKFLA